MGGIALKRDGADALTTIGNIKQKLDQLKPGLPEGVQITPVYDRSELIGRAIHTLTRTLIEESLIVAAVCMLFLLHARSALVAILTLPLGVLMAFAGMHRTTRKYRARDARISWRLGARGVVAAPRSSCEG